MKSTFKRFLAFLLVVVMTATLLPAGLVSAADSEQDSSVETVLTEADYAQTDALFAQISAMEEEPAKKAASQTQLTDAAAEIVMGSDNYVEGSLVRNGDAFTWTTIEGIRCAYSPRMRQINSEMTAPAEPVDDGAYNVPVAEKGGWPAGNQVYLIGPYYGYDSDFTDQYKNEAASIASAIGDTDGYTLYSGTGATVDTVAEAVSKGAVVIFDSHGMTDYESGYDYVTGATSSYLCLTSTTGLTTEDYNDGALYYSDGICINGATIANHMTSNSPNGLLWMAICLGMATDTMCQPLREMGVEVVYGYSQSVTFAGDYLYEETFWDNMCAGANVATAIANMKSAWGNWDWSTKIASYYGYTDGYSTISAARRDYAAFPVVVSDEDVHPGQRSGTSFYGADSLQTVNSTYTLYSQYDVTVQVNDSTYGSVSVSGNTITAVPATGYFAQGYTVLSGSATVTQNGNVFVVNASSDCVIQINFAAKTAVTVSFSGASVGAQTGYAGDEMELPVPTANEGFTFVGWMSAPINQDTTEKPNCYTDSFVPTGNTTLYALYSYIDADSGTGTGDYVKVTSARSDWSGEYLIVYEADGFVLNSTLSTIDAANNYVSVSINGDTISAQEGDPYKFTIASYNGEYSILGENGLYIGAETNANTLNSSATALKNTISLDASGNANIVGSGGAYLRYNTSASRFRYYKSGSYTNQKAIALYLKDGTGGTVYYTGNPTVCAHANTIPVNAVAATCTASGYTAGVFCIDCACYISGHETVAPLGHSYDAVVHSPTEIEQGYTTYTCAACGDSYVADYVPALGEARTVAFVVPSGVEAIEQVVSYDAGITLPVAGVPAGEYAYTFVGWAAGQVEDAEEMPGVLTGHYVPERDTVLYAVYSYTVGGSGVSEYVLTDLADIQSTDTVVITVDYSGTVYAMNNINGTSKAPDGVTVNVSTFGGVTKLDAEPEDSLKWNIVLQDGSYIIYPEGQTDVWLYCTSTNNGVRVGTGAANTFTIESDYLYNIGQSRYLGVYRTNPDWRCYTSINNNIVNETLGFYVKGEAGTTYYTTLSAAACEHSYTYSFVDSAHTLTCSACGDVQTVAGTNEFIIANTSVTLGTDINLQFKAYVDDCFSDVYMVFRVADENGEIVETTATDYTVDSKGRWVFTYEGVNPQLMGEMIDATMYGNLNGYQVEVYKSQSVEAYAKTLLGMSIDDATRQLVSDLLVYGAVAQEFKGYDVENPVTDGATNLTPSTFPGCATLGGHYKMDDSVVAANDTHDVITYALTLTNKVTLKLAMTLDDATKYTYQVTVNGAVLTYTSDDLTYDESKGRYYLMFDLLASELDSAVTLMILENGEQVSRAMTTSATDYIKKYGEGYGITSDLLQALYNYGKSAEAM